MTMLCCLIIWRCSVAWSYGDALLLCENGLIIQRCSVAWIHDDAPLLCENALLLDHMAMLQCYVEMLCSVAWCYDDALLLHHMAMLCCYVEMLCSVAWFMMMICYEVEILCCLIIWWFCGALLKFYVSLSFGDALLLNEIDLWFHHMTISLAWSYGDALVINFSTLGYGLNISRCLTLEQMINTFCLTIYKCSISSFLIDKFKYISMFSITCL